MRITKELLKKRVVEVRNEIDRIFRATDEALKSWWPGATLTGTREEIIDNLIKELVKEKFDPGP